MIAEPGLVPDLPFEEYLADPIEAGSLSHSGAKTIIKATPALFAYEREHGRANTRSFDRGHAAHQLILGVGPEIVAVDADDWRTKAAKAEADEARERGAIPILRDEMTAVTGMADALGAHPLAARLLEPGSGQPEVSAFTTDPDTGVWLRCRYDWLRAPETSGRLVLVDYKTCRDAGKDAFGKSAANYGYDLQDAWYTRIAELLGLAESIAFVFIAQETTPPYLVNVHQLDVTARQIGRIQMRRAIATYRSCTETGIWPGYGDDVTLTSLPLWYERAYEQDIAS